MGAVGSIGDGRLINESLVEYLLMSRHDKVDLKKVLDMHEKFPTDPSVYGEGQDGSADYDFGSISETPFVTACAKGYSGVASMILSYHADPSIKVAGRSAFAITLMQLKEEFASRRIQSQLHGDSTADVEDADDAAAHDDETSNDQEILNKYLAVLSLILQRDSSFSPFDKEFNLKGGHENCYQLMQDMKLGGVDVLTHLLKNHASFRDKEKIYQLNQKLQIQDEVIQEQAAELSAIKREMARISRVIEVSSNKSAHVMSSAEGGAKESNGANSNLPPEVKVVSAISLASQDPVAAIAKGARRG